ncbi:UMP kinase [Halocatena salina]|uniref:Uridylate kinase n=1 Tax=Halocatena salina TaxID=2934340 RepID=A0A8U0A7B8_9EURY|nr:UMP kinase [Halocatena salina]UPM43807.1 UMP kinase [Halocatena salina]
MRVIISVGGSVLAPDLDDERVRAYADCVETLRSAGHEIGLVVGGGKIAREYIETGRDLGANEMALDQLGIRVTRLNARLLIAALGEAAVPTPPECYETAAAALRRSEIPVMGGMVPGQTTDAVGAALAETVDADLLVYATSVSGVYSEDPEDNPDATHYEELATTDLVDIIGDIEMSAGSNAPVDLLAAKLIQRSGTRTIVLDGTDPDDVYRAIGASEHDGTEIVP